MFLDCIGFDLLHIGVFAITVPSEIVVAGAGNAPLQLGVLLCNFRMAPQVVAEGDVPADIGSPHRNA